MKYIFSFWILFSVFSLKAQQTATDSLRLADSLSKTTMMAKRDSMEKVMMAKLKFPLIKANKYCGVIPISEVDEKPSTGQRFRILYEVTTGIKDSAAKNMNEALVEVGRQINLHIAAGVPQKNLEVVVVAHGGILRSFYTDSAYQKRYKMNNPNDTLFAELNAAGVKFIACGQAMTFLDIDRQQLAPWVKVALSAQTVITGYQENGYVFRKLNSDD